MAKKISVKVDEPVVNEPQVFNYNDKLDKIIELLSKLNDRLSKISGG